MAFHAYPEQSAPLVRLITDIKYWQHTSIDKQRCKIMCLSIFITQFQKAHRFLFLFILQRIAQWQMRKFRSTFNLAINVQTIFYSFFLFSRYINFCNVTSLIISVDSASRTIHSLCLFNVTAAGLDLCLFKKSQPKRRV